MAEVVRHGDRWAVVERPGEPPTSEHATREAAELEARRAGAGAEVDVREDDPTGLDRVSDEPPERSAEAPQAGGEGGVDRPGARPGEGARERQAGL